MAREDYYKILSENLSEENYKLKRILNIYNNDNHLNFEDDVKTLMREIPDLQLLGPEAVAFLYGNYSEQYFCAGWLTIDKHTIAEFRGFLVKSEIITGE